MAKSEIIQPSFILTSDESEWFFPVLDYSPSFKCCLFHIKHDVLCFLNLDSHTTGKQNLHVDNRYTATKVAFSSDSSLLAVNSEIFADQSNQLSAQIRVVRFSNDPTSSSHPTPQSSVYIKPDFGRNIITKIKFFPDGSKIIAANTNNKPERPWCKIFTLPEGLWDESTDCDREPHNENRLNKTLACEEINVFQQGFPIPHDMTEINKDAATYEEYNELYYCSKVDGFFCLAISPDTLRILAGTNDGEIYIIETASGKILQCMRAYWYYHVVYGCHYNPVVGHEEFATCDEDGVLDIWHVEELDNGSEQTASVHRLKLEAGTSCCTYSPDGQLIAVTSAAVHKTYIICSHSAEILYTLVHKENITRETYNFQNSSLFVGHSCQVATVHEDKSLCCWKLPVIYSLKTLCLLVLRSAVKYNNIDNLPLPTPMKLQLKYLYV